MSGIQFNSYSQNFPSFGAQNRYNSQRRRTENGSKDSFSKSSNTLKNHPERYTCEPQQIQIYQERQIRRQRALRRKKAAQIKMAKSIISCMTAFSGIAAAISGIVGYTNQNQNKINTIDNDYKSYSYVEPYENPEKSTADILNEMGVEEVNPQEENEIAIEETNSQIKENEIQEIFSTNPEIKNSYDKLTEAADRFSEELGEDGISLINERVNVLGNNRVDAIDVLKILYIESRGRIYDPENPGRVITNDRSGATGPFQLTPDTIDYINYYYNLTGDDQLDITDPYDNLDACILYLRFINAMRSKDIENGKQLLTGDAIMHAVVWGYHDGPWANGVTEQAKDYISAFDELSEIDNSPEVRNYLLGK